MKDIDNIPEPDDFEDEDEYQDEDIAYWYCLACNYTMLENPGDICPRCGASAIDCIYE